MKLPFSIKCLLKPFVLLALMCRPNLYLGSPFLFPTYLGRSKGLSSLGILYKDAAIKQELVSSHDSVLKIWQLYNPRCL